MNGKTAPAPWLCGALVLAAAACSATIEGPGFGVGGTGSTSGQGSHTGTGNNPGSGGAAGGIVQPMPLTCAQSGDAPGRRLVRRLTTTEFETTIQAVFGISPAATWTGLLPPDPAAANGFGNNVDRLTVGTEFAAGMQDTGSRIASLVTNATNLPRLLACSSKGDMACAGTFLDSYGARLYRRPLTAAEKNRYLALYTKISKQSDFKTWVYWTTAALVQSPNAVYRSEMGEASGGGFKLTPYEIASALSYTFTGGPPSAALQQLAASNQLGTADQIEAAARTLVYDTNQNIRPEFRNLFLTFSDQWLGMTALGNKTKDSTAFPDFTPEVQDSLAGETRAFIASVVFDDRGKPADLLTAPYTFIDGTLASYYGFGSAGAAGTFVRTTRPDGWGLGLLAQGGLLAVKAGSLATSPTKRGHLVRTNLLCNPVPAPPPVVKPLPEPTAAETTRQRYEVIHLTDPNCRGCHQLMDPIGFGLEHLDASGRYRAKEGAFDIDDSGTMLLSQGGSTTFKGPNELAQTLARMPETSDCLAAFMASFAFGVDQSEATCMVASATKDLRAGTLSLVDYYIRLARSEHFRTRSQ